jgi:hypothetical protein
MNLTKRQLYAAGEPLGDCVTRIEAGRLICGGGGGSDGVTTQSPTIPDELKGAASSLSKIATQVGNTPYQAYGGDGVAGLNSMQTGAMDMIQQRAANGSPIMDAANSTLTGMLQGGQTNPYLDSMVQKAQDSVKSNFNTGAVNSGSFGNSGLQQQYAAGLTDVATQMYGNAYNTDRANQMQALGMAQSYGNQDYNDASQLMNAGTAAQNNAQDQADFNYQQYTNQQNYPLQQLSALGGTLNGQMGSTSTTTGSGK